MIIYLMLAFLTHDHGTTVKPFISCGTFELMKHTHDMPVVPHSIRLKDKQTRDLADLPHSMESENFVLRWGDNMPDRDLAGLLALFEEAWRVEVGELGYKQPIGTQGFKFNVYMGDSGPGTPTIGEYGGYTTFDSEGYPYIVLNTGLFFDWENLRAHAGHELFHAVQFSYGWNSVGTTAAANWFGEASATWVVSSVWPESRYMDYLGGFAHYPQYPVDSFFTIVPGDQLQQLTLHQYGAFIYLRFLAEFLTSPDLIQDVWNAMEATGNYEALKVMHGLLADKGYSGSKAFARFTNHNVDWDYQDGDHYGRSIQASQDFFNHTNRIAAEHNSADAVWHTPLPSFLPRRYAANYIKLNAPGPIHVSFEGDATGGLGSSSGWQASVVVVGNHRPIYHSISLVDGAGEFTLPHLGEQETLYLAIVNTPDSTDNSETFSYRYRFQIAQALPVQNDRLLIPHFTTKKGLWDTGIALSNPTDGNLQTQIKAWSEDGRNLGTIDLSIPPQTGFHHSMNEIFPHLSGEAGWLELSSNDSGLAGMLTFQFLSTGGSASLPLDGSTGTLLHFPLMENNGKRQSGLVIVNPGDQAVEIQLTFSGLDGNYNNGKSLVLEAREKTAVMLGDLLGDGIPKEGILTVASTGDITGFALTFQGNNEQIFAVPGTLRY